MSNMMEDGFFDEPEDDKTYWEYIEGGNSTCNKAYQLYRDMGPTRTLSKVAEEMGMAATSIRQYSCDYDFIKRIKAYEKYMAEYRTIAREEAISKAEDELVNSLGQLLSVGIQGAIDGTIKNAQATMIRDLLDRAGMDVIERKKVEFNINEEELYNLLGAVPDDDE